MPYEPTRYCKVPWGWLEPSDLRRAGKPEGDVRCGASVHIYGLVITGCDDMLGVKVVNGVPVSAALTMVFDLDTDTMQSNPRRAQGDGDPGDAA